MSKPLSVPPELKKMTQFIRRAEELDRDKKPESRLVAYYCRQHAVTVGIGLSNSPDSKKCLSQLLSSLEAEKGPMSNFTREEAHFICRKFAEGIFDKADAEDRAGASTKNTARTFYAAATFFEMLQQFHDVDVYGEDMQEADKQKRMYCKWKATEILKAIKEGRPIEPGGFGETEYQPDQSMAQRDDGDMQSAPQEQGAGASDYDDIVQSPSNSEMQEQGQGTEVTMGSSPRPFTSGAETVMANEINEGGRTLLSDQSLGSTVSVMPPPPLPSVTQLPPAPQPSAPAPAPTKDKSKFSMFGRKSKSRASNETIEDVIELTRFALSALEGRDVELGAQRLEEALAQLNR